jgi:hypothetical protein
VTDRLFDRHREEVQQTLDQTSNLLLLLRDAPEELLDGSLLAVGVIAELHQLLLHSVEMKSKVINVLTWIEDQVLPLLVKCLQRGLVSAVAADACHDNGSQASLAVCFLESENCISDENVAMRASNAHRSS